MMMFKQLEQVKDIITKSPYNFTFREDPLKVQSQSNWWIIAEKRVKRVFSFKGIFNLQCSGPNIDNPRVCIEYPKITWTPLKSDYAVFYTEYKSLDLEEVVDVLLADHYDCLADKFKILEYAEQFKNEDRDFMKYKTYLFYLEQKQKYGVSINSYEAVALSEFKLEYAPREDINLSDFIGAL